MSGSVQTASGAHTTLHEPCLVWCDGMAPWARVSIGGAAIGYGVRAIVMIRAAPGRCYVASLNVMEVLLNLGYVVVPFINL